MDQMIKTKTHMQLFEKVAGSTLEVEEVGFQPHKIHVWYILLDFPTFTREITEMFVDIPYMDPMGMADKQSSTSCSLLCHLSSGLRSQHYWQLDSHLARWTATCVSWGSQWFGNIPPRTHKVNPKTSYK